MIDLKCRHVCHLATKCVCHLAMALILGSCYPNDTMFSCTQCLDSFSNECNASVVFFGQAIRSEEEQGRSFTSRCVEPFEWHDVLPSSGLLAGHTASSVADHVPPFLLQSQAMWLVPHKLVSLTLGSISLCLRYCQPTTTTRVADANSYAS